MPVPTPFGTIYSTNITPDPETGIGRWSEAAFQRAMREGVDREGNHLYPAFPYDHFTLVSDEDNSALYAYLMTREPVEATAPANDLPFPAEHPARCSPDGSCSIFDEGAFQPRSDQSEAWNRGAYLAEGLGHCGACHTPRNALGAEDRDRHFAGGEAEGWQAYAIDETSPAPIPWDAESLAFYLRHGWHEQHGVSRGPMAEVTGNLGGLPDSGHRRHRHLCRVADGRAVGRAPPAKRKRCSAGWRRSLAKSLRRPRDSQAAPQPASGDRGAAIYAGACATCHESGRPLPFGGLDFALSTAVNAPNPQNIVNVTLFGLPAADGEASSVMPGFAGVLVRCRMSRSCSPICASASPTGRHGRASRNMCGATRTRRA